MTELASAGSFPFLLWSITANGFFSRMNRWHTVPVTGVDEQPDNGVKTVVMKDWEEAYHKEDCQFCSAHPGTTDRVPSHQRVRDESRVVHQPHPADLPVAFWTTRYCTSQNRTHPPDRNAE